MSIQQPFSIIEQLVKLSPHSKKVEESESGLGLDMWHLWTIWVKFACSLHPHRFSPGTLVFFYRPKTHIRLIGNSKLPLCIYCLSMCSCDGLGTCLHCPLPLAPWLLDMATHDTCDPERRNQVKVMNIIHLIIF